MKLGVFGDSFGVQMQNQPYLGWVDLLNQDFDIINHCECGVGQYKILKQLQSVDLKQFDKILITHTSATRVYVKDNPLHLHSKYHQNCDIIFSDIDQGDTEFSQACRLYFKHIFDVDYAVDIHNMICQQIDQLCRNLPVVHITHFDYTHLYQFPDMINFYDLFLQHRGPVNHYDQFGNGQVYQSLRKVL